jgi:transcription elongation factor GreA
MTDTHYLTKSGFEKLQAEMGELKERRKTVTKRIEEAIKMGDLSENAEYSDAKEEQAFVEGRIAEIDAILKNSEMIDKNGGAKGKVALGSTVRVKLRTKEHRFTIVGPEESNPGSGFISHESPLGKAFLGCKKGDKVPVQTPSGTIEYQILSVS